MKTNLCCRKIKKNPLLKRQSGSPIPVWSSLLLPKILRVLSKKFLSCLDLPQRKKYILPPCVDLCPPKKIFLCLSSLKKYPRVLSALQKNKIPYSVSSILFIWQPYLFNYAWWPLQYGKYDCQYGMHDHLCTRFLILPSQRISHSATIFSYTLYLSGFENSPTSGGRFLWRMRSVERIWFLRDTDLGFLFTANPFDRRPCASRSHRALFFWSEFEGNWGFLFLYQDSSIDEHQEHPATIWQGTQHSGSSISL